MNFENYFEATYQYVLENITYNRLPETADSFEITLLDTMKFTLLQNDLHVLVERNLSIQPKCLFELKVAYGILLHFKDGCSVQHTDEEWLEFFSKNDNPYTSLVMSRISLVISQITAANGQQPLVTPPQFQQ